MSTEELSKAYDPAEVESKWYKIWEERGYFHADVNSSKKPYTIVIPPPNVTGQLTMGRMISIGRFGLSPMADSSEST